MIFLIANLGANSWCSISLLLPFEVVNASSGLHPVK